MVDKIAVCRQQKALVAENARKEQIYRKAQSAMGETDASLIKAIELFESIRDFRDSAQEIQKCQNILQKRAAQREAEAKAKEQGKKLAVLIPVIVVVFALAIVGFWAWSRLSNKPAPDTKTVAVKDNAPFAQAQKGGVIQFGHFKEQPIEWLVAEKENGKLLLIAKKALTGHAYSSGQCDWQTSGVRKWLNSDMLAAMFTPDEQKYLVEENGDKVFLFSRARADKYLSAESMLCKPTEYAKKNGAPAAANGCCDWWLKDLSGKMQGQALFVDSAGKVYDTPGGPVTETGGIRPAVWVNAE